MNILYVPMVKKYYIYELLESGIHKVYYTNLINGVMDFKQYPREIADDYIKTKQWILLTKEEFESKFAF